MSEWCKFPFNDTDTVLDAEKLKDKVLEGHGAVYAPFTMFNLSDEYEMTWVRNTHGQAFASNMPLTDGNYWIFYLWCDNATDLLGRYVQGQPIVTGDFKCYFVFTSKPLILSNITTVKRLPSMSKTQLVKFGDLGLPKQTEVQFKHLDYDSMTATLSELECLKILYQRENEWRRSLYDMYPLWRPGDNE